MATLEARLSSLVARVGTEFKSIRTSLSGKEPALAAGTSTQFYRGDKSWQVLDKTAVGLSNVQNLAVYVLAVGAPDPTGASPAGLYIRQTS